MKVNLAINTMPGGTDELTRDSTGLQVPTHGLSVLTCALFIVGEMAGSGVLALPRAITNSGWSGVGLLIVCALVSLYCGVMLGKCWMQVREKACVDEPFPRDPYPTIGYECYGRLGRGIVECCLLATLIGVSIVLLLISAQNISSLVDKKIGSVDTPVNEARIWLLIISVCIVPFIYLGTPKNLWPFAVIATATTSIACCLIIIKSCIDWPSDLNTVPTADVTVDSFFTAFGTISFAFGGASLFPSFQADMKEPAKFTRSAISAFLIVLLMYLPTCIFPFIVYGANNKDNALQTIKSQGYKGSVRNIAVVAEVLITFHLLFSFLIVLNPVSQQFEEFLKWPNRFGWRRFVLRTGIFLFVLGIAEAVPKFGVILSLIGGSTVTMMAFILPCIFYLKLNPDSPLYIKVLHIEIILVALASGCTATYSAIVAIKKTFS